MCIVMDTKGVGKSMTTGSNGQQTLATTDTFFAKVVSSVQQKICGLHGHDSLLHFEEGRISLLCTSCGHQSPGWVVKKTPAHHHAEAPAQHVVSLPLLGARRAA